MLPRRLENPFSSFSDYPARFDEQHFVFNIGNDLLFQLSVHQTLMTAVVEKVFTARLPCILFPEAAGGYKEMSSILADQ